MTMMSQDSELPRYVLFPDRALVRIAGEDARGFLQGIVTNDVANVSPERAVYAALLTPQGKFLHDFFIVEWRDALALETRADRLDDLLRRLRMYKLRSKVEIERLEQAFAMFALIGEGAAARAGLSGVAGECRGFAGGIAFVDPRLAALGARAILPGDGAAALAEAGFRPVEVDDYDAERIALGVPEGGRELRPEQSLLLENGFEELHGVDFEKGCYVGQEVTARMKHRNLVRKRLLPVRIEGETPAAGTRVRRGEAEAGELISVMGGAGLAMLKLDHVRAALESGEPMTAGAARIVPEKPRWAAF